MRTLAILVRERHCHVVVLKPPKHFFVPALRYRRVVEFIPNRRHTGRNNVSVRSATSYAFDCTTVRPANR